MQVAKLQGYKVQSATYNESRAEMHNGGATAFEAVKTWFDSMLRCQTRGVSNVADQNRVPGVWISELAV